MEKMHITNQEHDAFVKSHPNGDLLQLTKWAETKKLTGWYARRIAVGRDGEIRVLRSYFLKKYLNYLIRYVIFHVVLLLIIVIKRR